MLVRIGDEKREMIEAHLGVLKSKCVDTGKHEVETMPETMQTLVSVIHNLPHKVGVYAALVALIAGDNAAMASDLVSFVTNTLKTVFVNEQDAFKSRNVFRFLAYLVDLRVICAKSACSFLMNILDECQKAGENF